MPDVQILGVRPGPVIELLATSPDGQRMRHSRHVGYVDLTAPYQQAMGEISFWLPDSGTHGVDAQQPSTVISALVLPAGESTSIPETRVIVHDARAWLGSTATDPQTLRIAVGVRLETWRFSSSTAFVLGYQVDCVVPAGHDIGAAPIIT